MLGKSKKGITGMITLYVGITVAVILVSSVVFPEIFNVNSTNWSTSAVSMWGVVPIVIIAGLVIMILR